MWGAYYFYASICVAATLFIVLLVKKCFFLKKIISFNSIRAKWCDAGSGD